MALQQREQIRDPLPNVAFYGEAAPWPRAESLHSEPLLDRSQLHNWVIRPHQHCNLTQLFLLLEGEGVAHLDLVPYSVTSPTVIVVPQRCVHEFQWAEASRGFVLSLTSSLVEDINRQIGPHDSIFTQPIAVDILDHRNLIAELFAAIHDEYLEQQPLKKQSLDHLIRALSIWLTRRVPKQCELPGRAGRASVHFSRFTGLVNEHFAAQWSVETYANEIGITSAHLNAICQKLVGSSALGVIHDRLILAAQRDLAYTEKAITAVSDGLGFSDPSYFTRFFKRQTNVTPGAYRKRSRAYGVRRG
jgi:AraC family transcriptional regulator, transcriptional activator of pobA